MQEDIKTDEQKKTENSRIYVLFYSFFLIPFMIAVFGAVFFLLFKFVTYETNDVEELLNQVKIGSASKRWQSAFELAKVLNNPDKDPLSNSFKDQLSSAYERSIHDDGLVRSYLAMAMGATKDTIFGESLVNGLKDENIETRIAAIQALGMIQYGPAVSPISTLIKTADSESERLSATISLGMIGDDSSIPFLIKLLEDEQANIRWDAAIALAKMGNSEGAYIIEGLLDRKYLNKFSEIDPIEQKRVLMIAIKTASILFDKRFEDNLILLSKNDKDLSIRDAAIKALEKKYSNGTNKL
ncbi:MAG: HEAT repeat domain-containing protein [Candidatus Neomarinimicrobiota bacterium]|tara:strand:+ start:378 stop:1271 length:894 start_codon:yes stop_codon:yes gene_type:complete